MKSLWSVKTPCAKVSESLSVVSDSLQPMDYTVPWNSLSQNTGVDSFSLPQGIFPTQESKSGLLHYRQILYQLNHKGSPRILEWLAFPFSSGSSWPRNQPGVSCRRIAGGFFTNWAIRKAQYSVIVESNSLCFAWINQWSWNKNQLHFSAETTWAEHVASSLLHLFHSM